MNPIPAPAEAATRRDRRRLLSWWPGWAVATFAVLAFHARPAQTPLDVDEFYWIGSAYYYHLAFERGEWNHPDWRLLPARENPPVAKYALGLGLALSGQPITNPDLLGAFYLIFQGVPHGWGEGEAHAKRNAVASRARPELRRQLESGAKLQLDTPLLLAGRRTILALMVVTGLLAFLLAGRLVHPLAGLLASGLLLAHPAVVPSYNLAHSDVVALLFSVAAGAAAFALARRLRDEPVGRATFGLAGATGLLVALACGAKMNALVVAALAGLAVLCALAQRWRRERRGFPRAVAAAGTAGVAAIVVFIAINPAITGDVFGGLAATVTEHRATEQIQARFMRDHLTALPEKFAAVGRLAAGSAAVLAAVALVAAVVLGRSRDDGLRFLALWFLVGLLAVTLWIPFPIGRYVLPVVLPGVLLCAALVATGAVRMWQRWRPKPPA